MHLSFGSRRPITQLSHHLKALCPRPFGSSAASWSLWRAAEMGSHPEIRWLRSPALFVCLGLVLCGSILLSTHKRTNGTHGTALDVSAVNAVYISSVGEIGEFPTANYLREAFRQALSESLAGSTQAPLVLVSQKELDPAIDSVTPRRFGAKTIVQAWTKTAGDQITLNVRLVDCKQDRVFWSKTLSGTPGMLAPKIPFVLSEILAILDPAAVRHRSCVARDMSAFEYINYVKAQRLLNGAPSRISMESALDLLRIAFNPESESKCRYAAVAEASLGIYEISQERAYLELARAAIDRGLAAQAQCVLGEFRLGQLLEQSGQNTRALITYQRLAESAPFSDGIQRVLARCYQSRGLFDLGLRVSRNALSINTKSWSNQFSLGNSYILTGDYSNAITAFKAAIYIDPTSFKAYSNLGAAYLYEDAYGPATLFLRKAISINEDPAVYSNLGTALLGERRFAESIAAFESAFHRQPDSHVYAANLGLAYRYTGNLRAARRYFAAAAQLALASSERNTRPALTEGRIAYYNSLLGRPRIARKLITSARNLDPRNTELLYDDLIIETRTRNFARSRELLKELISQNYPISRIRRDPDLVVLFTEPRFSLTLEPR